MPESSNNQLRLEYDDRDYQTLKLAAVYTDSQSLRAWATKTLLDAARQTVTKHQVQAVHAGCPVPEREGGAP